MVHIVEAASVNKANRPKAAALLQASAGVLLGLPKIKVGGWRWCEFSFHEFIYFLFVVVFHIFKKVKRRINTVL